MRLSKPQYVRMHEGSSSTVSSREKPISAVQRLCETLFASITAASKLAF
jgi:hypothetical protein